jgi:Mrp family chromosome partitioning ATPase
MIVTFYSYKGGTGRTMAAANIACLLAKAGRRVLLVDFDLEAPGVWRYFEDFQRGLDRQAGLIELLTEQATERLGYDGYPSTKPVSPDWRRYVTPVRIGTSSVTLLTSGVQDDEYPAAGPGAAGAVPVREPD